MTSTPKVDGREVMVRYRGVHKAFGTKQVLNGLDLDVHKGETFAIMGPSGCGKSVTLRHVIGPLECQSAQSWLRCIFGGNGTGLAFYLQLQRVLEPCLFGRQRHGQGSSNRFYTSVQRELTQD